MTRFTITMLHRGTETISRVFVVELDECNTDGMDDTSIVWENYGRKDEVCAVCERVI